MLNFGFFPEIINALKVYYEIKESGVAIRKFGEFGNYKSKAKVTKWHDKGKIQVPFLFGN